tara:strand:+ start:2018 stop:2764 length:747 start_codon:yes stop_codon:yes gene_type:complete
VLRPGYPFPKTPSFDEILILYRPILVQIARQTGHMKHMSSVLAALSAVFLSGPAIAAVIGSYTYDYTSTGNRDGQGFAQSAAGVQIVDNGTIFTDSFAFGGLSGATIDSFELTFAFSGAGPTSFFGLFPIEQWNASVGTTNPLDTSSFLLGTLVDDNSPATGFVVSGSTGDEADVFNAALANLGLSFSFAENGIFNGVAAFDLASVSLTVNGTAASAVVPLPAPGFLLLAALGGLGLMRRKSRTPASV